MAATLNTANPTAQLKETTYNHSMIDPQTDMPSALLRLSMSLYDIGYGIGYNAGLAGKLRINDHNQEDTHEKLVIQIVQDFINSDLTEQDMRDFQLIFNN